MKPLTIASILFVLAMAAIQLFSEVKNNDWLFFYDVTVFGYIVTIFLLNLHNKIMACLTPVVMYMFAVIIYQYISGESTQTIGPIYTFAFVALVFPIIYVIRRR